MSRGGWRRLLGLARERFGVEELRPGQRELLEAVLAGRDAVGILPTGAGKSLCFQLPALVLPHPTIVVSPLLALMRDQQEKLAAESDIDAAKLDSTLSAADERAVDEELREGEHALVYVTPERLERPDQVALLASAGVSLFVVDEAHCISQWGHDFRPAYLTLGDAARQLGRPPILALTATSTPRVTRDIVTLLGLRDPVVVDTGIDRPNLAFEVAPTVSTAAKRERLLALLREEAGSGIVYAATVRAVNELWRWLTTVEPRTGRYHGKLRKAEREEAQRRFMSDEDRLMVATKAFGLGIDKPDIRFVVHWQFPDSLESYYQEAGRAGRDGEPARAVLLYRLEDRRVQSFFLGGKYPRREESQRVWEALARAGGEVTPAALIEAAGVGERRGKVAIAQLVSTGIAERRRGRLRPVRSFADAGELERFLTAYEERHVDDRARLERMMRYAESAGCRVAFLRAYFGLADPTPCGVCDNCRHPPEARGAPRPRRRRSPAVRPAAPPPFAIGEQVRHAEFGLGQVTACEGARVTAQFADGTVRTVRADYLARVGPPSAPEARAPG